METGSPFNVIFAPYKINPRSLIELNTDVNALGKAPDGILVIRSLFFMFGGFLRCEPNPFHVDFLQRVLGEVQLLFLTIVFSMDSTSHYC